MENEIDLTFEKVIKGFSGNIEDLEKAIGVYIVGVQFGWRVLLLIHDRRTIKKYSDILGINLTEVCPEVGPCADKSNAWIAVSKIKSYWKAVRGEIPDIKTSLIS